MTSKKYRDFVSITGSLGVLSMGGWILIDPSGCWYGYCWDWSPKHTYVGSMIAVVGLVMLSLAIKGVKQTGSASICAKCESVQVVEVDVNTCRDCGGELEPLKGYYERHREKKR